MLLTELFLVISFPENANFENSMQCVAYERTQFDWRNTVSVSLHLVYCMPCSSGTKTGDKLGESGLAFRLSDL